MESGSQFGLIKEYYDELERDPESPIFVALADAYRESGLLEEALAVCQRGIQVHPNYAAARLVLGQIYIDKEMLDLAEQEVELALQLDANNATVLATLGMIHGLTGRLESATRYLDHAHFLNPDDPKIAAFLEEAKQALAANPTQRTTSRVSELESAASGVPEAQPAVDDSAADKLLQELSGIEGIDGAVLIGTNGRYRSSVDAGRYLEDTVGQSLSSLCLSSDESPAGILGSIKQILVEGSEGSFLAASLGGEMVAVIMSASAQPGSISLSLEEYMAQGG